MMLEMAFQSVLRKMKKNKTLLLVNNANIVDKLKDERDISFLFPLKNYTVGFDNTFQVEDIPDGGFIFVNRIMDNQTIREFRQILENLPDKIKGIVFDDIGVLNILLELNLNITKILFLNHLNCNYESINAYLNYVQSVVVCPDITFDEIDEILQKAKKPVVLYTFGYINIMYSRRTLLTNYNKNFKKNIKNKARLEDIITKKKFNIWEENNGTVIYTESPFNGLKLREKDNVLYNLINAVFLSDDEVLNIIHDETNLEEKYPYKYLSERGTIFKLKEEQS